MRSIRFSVAASMTAILAIAGLLAMLRFPSSMLANALFSLVILGLSLTLIGVIFARRFERARWAGALIAGGITFALHFVPWLDQRFGDLLITAALADILYERFAAPLPEEAVDEATTGLDSSASRPARFILARYYGGFGGGKGGFGGPPTPPPSAFETWTDIDRGPAPSGFSPPRRVGGGITIFNPAPAAMQRIVDCLAVLLSAMIGAVFAIRCTARGPSTAIEPARS